MTLADRVENILSLLNLHSDDPWIKKYVPAVESEIREAVEEAVAKYEAVVYAAKSPDLCHGPTCLMPSDANPCVCGLAELEQAVNALSPDSKK